MRKWHTYTVHVQLLCTCDALGNGVDDVHHGSLSFCVSFSLPVRVCACVCVFACVCVYVWHVVVAIDAYWRGATGDGTAATRGWLGHWVMLALFSW